MNTAIIAKGALARFGIRNCPLSVTFEVTYRCNLACRYCDRHTPLPHEMSREQIFAALRQFHNRGMQCISLDGGEPLTHPDIHEIVQWLVTHNLDVFMNTNGILVPKNLGTIKKLSRVKISLDGPPEKHDRMRGAGAFKKAVSGARAARDAGVTVELTCTVGRHNIDHLDWLIDFTNDLGLTIIFQPVMDSLFLDTERDSSAFRAGNAAVRKAFRSLELRKKSSPAIANSWSSFRHFRTFPNDTWLPCTAGRVTTTMDPEGVLFQCSQVNRSDRSNSVTRSGVAAAFANLPRKSCPQCWCARLVEANYDWGCRFDKRLPPPVVPG